LGHLPTMQWKIGARSSSHGPSVPPAVSHKQLITRCLRDEGYLTSCIQRGSAARKLDPGDDESVTALYNLALRSQENWRGVSPRQSPSLFYQAKVREPPRRR